LPNITARRTTPRRFVPDAFDPLEPGALEQIFSELETRDVTTRDDLERFILDWEELGAVLYESYAAAYIDMTVDTTNPQYEERYLKIVDEMMPIKEQRDFDLKKKLLASPAVNDLGHEYAMLLRNVKSEVGIFREENVPLVVEMRKLEQEYNKIAGAEQAEFRGETYTLPQLMPFLQEPDRDAREGAWRARWGAKLADAGTLDDLYTRLYDIRQTMARNAGFANYRDYMFEEMKRFDYTPDDCIRFHEAIEKHIVPVVSQDWEERRQQLGVDTLRPWDLDVDPEGAARLKPFEDVSRLQEGCHRITEQIDPELGDYFREMIDSGLLDLENRPGKAPGGYMTMLSDIQVPFIFMNAVGSKNDIEVLLHEGGHSFHYYLSRKHPLASLHFPTSEFSEVGSMSMELLARPYLSEFFSEEDLTRLLKDQLREKIRFFPFMAMIDAFQHWVYTAEDHGTDARKARWTELEARFRPGLDWSGLEQFREAGWQYPHVMDTPFYYVEYGIAQLAALRVWLNSLHDERGAVDAYKRALALGGTRPLPELFTTAGAEFALNDRTVREIVEGTLTQINS
jgi:oligoendopeptidase F